MIKGSCLCGKVTYEVTELISPIVFCHCSFCRKASSTAFSANALVDLASFQLLSGQEALVIYESSPRKIRHYCKQCHSQLYHTKADMPGQLTLKLGTIDRCDQDLGKLERKHIHDEQTVPWLYSSKINI
ncbi:GFA family protein [Streptococcus sp. zg-86]|uniref:GFA family protein n=1 Tax=Streptococcus zhangguiae TaxID=2664091 RepID=A0A6I4R883_9STRE|nr:MULTISPECIES: GFA family protein [unclassified Streptococcus]MTB63768.1 GFA family protein [Streptococcus sp. zg-86]MTB90078.1 GFA family protein [Streptococcus sp. zg-36]MWV55749.1 GFA family protein [Streptococcus sp. zg-70]QTH47962.1 GFA family protein [Streptococcus sp. zg-86]